MEEIVNSISDPITTLSGGYTAGAGTLAVNAPTAPDAWPVNREFRVRIANELFIVTAATSNATSLTVVTFAAEGTTSVGHSTSDNVYLVYTKASLLRYFKKIQNIGDVPPASPNAMDDEFGGSSLDAKWSWRNQGTSTYTADFDNAVAKLVPQLGANVPAVRILEQNVPAGSGDFTATFKLFPALPSITNGYSAGIVLVNSTSGRLLTIEYYSLTSARGFRLSRYNSVTSFNSINSSMYSAAASTAVALPATNPIYLRFVTAGSRATVTPYFSGDGYSWAQSSSNDTIASFLTATGGTWDKVGIYCDAEDSSRTAEVTLYHFRIS